MWQSGFSWNRTDTGVSERNKAVQQHWLNFEELDVSRLQFAVAITTGETTGGMTWEEYRFDNFDLGRFQNFYTLYVQ